jgi:putative component of toxin-antitoxin plasmid stabilization module
MITVRETEAFHLWLMGLRDVIAKRQINRRIARIISTGNFGDFASVGDG